MQFVIAFGIFLSVLRDFPNGMQNRCVVASAKQFADLRKALLREFLRQVHGDLAWSGDIGGPSFGIHISYTSIRGNNVLSLRVGRFTASLHASLSTLRQLRAEGIDTITFQTILCSTTLSVDELLAMGGEDAEVVLTHHIRSSTLTVGGKAV